ncbi:hypothetical protein IC582_021577 [Cucumis melo]
MWHFSIGSLLVTDKSNHFLHGETSLERPLNREISVVLGLFFTLNFLKRKVR